MGRRRFLAGPRDPCPRGSWAIGDGRRSNSLRGTVAGQAAGGQRSHRDTELGRIFTHRLSSREAEVKKAARNFAPAAQGCHSPDTAGKGPPISFDTC